MGLGFVLLLAVMASLLASASGGLPAEIPLSHSIDGVDYQDAGSIRLGAQGGVIDTEKYKAALAKILPSSSDAGSYFVRSQGVVGSIPLSCWKRAGAGAGLSLTLHADDSISSISLTAPCADARGRDGRPAEIKSISVSRPHVVRSSLLHEHGMINIATGMSGGELIANDAGGSAVGKKGNNINNINNKATTQKPDERTWLQKNWLFVALAFFIFANKLGQGIEQPRRAAPPGSSGAPRPHDSGAR